MKKKKLEAKLAKTKKKLADTKTELDAMLSIMEASGMPKAGSKPVAGRPDVPKNKASTPTAKPAARAKTPGPATKTPKKAKAK